MASWNELSEQAPEIADAGWRLLHADEIPIGFMATARADGRLHLSPVCPIFAGGHFYLSAGAPTPKHRDLLETGRFVLHAFLGTDDEEFAFTGHAALILDDAERAAVHAAIKFGSFDREDPIFRLDIKSCLWVMWENPGTPASRKRMQRWRAAAPAAG